MQAFTFAEINLRKCCFRIARVIARTEDAARKLIPGGDWAWGLIGTGKSRATKPSVRTQLFYKREEFARLCSKFELTVEEVETRIRSATNPGFAIARDGRWIER